MNRLKTLRSPVLARAQRGVTLIEILITLLVLAVGLLGLAALQGFSLQASNVSYYRTQATNVAYEVADFARANRSVTTAAQLTAVGNNLAAQYLPSGTAAVAMDGGADEITVTVQWLDDRSADEEASFVITTRI